MYWATQLSTWLEADIARYNPIPTAEHSTVEPVLGLTSRTKGAAHPDSNIMKPNSEIMIFIMATSTNFCRPWPLVTKLLLRVKRGG